MSDPANFVRPPEKCSKAKIQEWVYAEVAATNPSLPARLVDTEEWSDYVNHHHFIPMSVEGVPEGFVFDYKRGKSPPSFAQR